MWIQNAYSIKSLILECEYQTKLDIITSYQVFCRAMGAHWGVSVCKGWYGYKQPYRSLVIPIFQKCLVPQYPTSTTNTKIWKIKFVSSNPWCYHSYCIFFQSYALNSLSPFLRPWINYFLISYGVGVKIGLKEIIYVLITLWVAYEWLMLSALPRHKKWCGWNICLMISMIACGNLLNCLFYTDFILM